MWNESGVHFCGPIHAVTSAVRWFDRVKDGALTTQSMVFIARPDLLVDLETKKRVYFQYVDQLIMA